MMITLLFLVISLAIYFLPTIVAFKRVHKNRVPILVVDLFLGWTLLGWVVALAWSLTDNTQTTEVSRAN